MKKIKVEFSGGESRFKVGDDTQGVDYMLAYATNENEEDIELYAEVDVKGSPFELDFSEAVTSEEKSEIADTLDCEAFSKYSYPILKKEIINQAVENGINPEMLEFLCK